MFTLIMKFVPVFLVLFHCINGFSSPNQEVTVRGKKYLEENATWYVQDHGVKFELEP